MTVEEEKAIDNHHARQGINRPKFRELLKHMEKFGPECVVESSYHLPLEQISILGARANKMKWNKTRKKWER